MVWWAGAHSLDVRSRMVDWSSFDKMKEMQRMLLLAGGKKVSIWLRAREGYVCSCLHGGELREHNQCWGTGILGGYFKAGSKEWIVGKGSEGYLIVTKDNGYSVLPEIIGNEIRIESEWIDVVGEVVPEAFAKSNVTVEFTVDGSVWVTSVVVREGRFKFRVTGVERDVLGTRIRIPDGQKSEILVSEHPPLRLEEWVKWGFGKDVVDIRGWTVSDILLNTGDLLEWEEGVYQGYRYVISNVRVSQFPYSREESGQITQVLGLRYVRPEQVLSKVV
uniref:Uncharacterized protein n=1 Tax=candidate division CPR3 bacterium TaxID=2268181 RepID=A0A7V3N475_UNCC3